MAAEDETMDCSTEEFIIRAKGFSFDVQATDLSAFFAGCDIKGGKGKGIHFVYSGTVRSKTEAFIEFYENDDLRKALQLHKKYLGDRYVDVARSTREEMETALEDSDSKQDLEEFHVIKLTGMPFTALHDDVAVFFAGTDIKGGKKNGVSFLRNDDGTASGGCYVEFLTMEDTHLALSKDRQYMGSRFCHVTKSSADERDSAIERQTEVLQDLSVPILKLKGLPFKTSDTDIKAFFPELEIISVEMVLNEQGNCKGDAYVEFGSLFDAKEAIKSYKLRLLHRYIDVTKSTKAEWMAAIPQSDKITKSIDDLDEPIVRLTNLPLKVTKDEISDFFFGIDCRAVQIVRLPRGDCNGEAFIEFKSLEDTVKALAKHKQPLADDSETGKKIDVIASSRCDWRKDPLPKSKSDKSGKSSDRDTSSSRKRPLALDHSSSGDRYQQPRISAPVGYPNVTYTGYNQSQVGYGDHDRLEAEYLVNMVGLPFSATEEDVKQFFYPVKMSNVQFLSNDRGQARGIAVVGFYSEEERLEAMKRHKNSIGSRYVNLHIRNESREYEFDFTKGGYHGALPGSKRSSYDRSYSSNNSYSRDPRMYNSSRHSSDRSYYR